MKTELNSGIRGTEMDNKWIDNKVAELKNQIKDGKVLLALSGGVDSSVCAALLQKAVGSQLTCVFVDTGLMRKNEPETVEEVMKNRMGINLIMVKAEERFLSHLCGVTDPEQKRKIIGEQFIRIFEEEAKKIGKVDFLGQGTIYPDIIESGKNGNGLVKSHHNVGGLPEHVDFKELVEPLKELYKPDVRELGRLLGLPDVLTKRQPFPGPGLGVRCIGELTKEKLDILREADAIFREEIEKNGLSDGINQYFAALTNIKAVGVKDGQRTYKYAVALRAVITENFVTAKAANLSFEFLHHVGQRITSEVPEINRVLYEVTDKGPSTIEFE